MLHYIHLKNAVRGLFDQVGYGFHRYATDREWLLPHFEKMLYDQALLIMAYIEAYEYTNDRFYEKLFMKIITYVIRDMNHPEGGFYTAEDADSEERRVSFMCGKKRIRYSFRQLCRMDQSNLEYTRKG